MDSRVRGSDTEQPWGLPEGRWGVFSAPSGSHSCDSRTSQAVVQKCVSREDSWAGSGGGGVISGRAPRRGHLGLSWEGRW